MGKGNPLMRVDRDFERIVKGIQDASDKTSAQVTRAIARGMKKIKV